MPVCKQPVATLACTLFLDEGAEVGHFACNLVFGTENVGVVLHKAAHAHQAVHRTGRFVTVALTKHKTGLPKCIIELGRGKPLASALHVT